MWKKATEWNGGTKKSEIRIGETWIECNNDNPGTFSIFNVGSWLLSWFQWFLRKIKEKKSISNFNTFFSLRKENGMSSVRIGNFMNSISILIQFFSCFRCYPFGLLLDCIISFEMPFIIGIKILLLNSLCVSIDRANGSIMLTLKRMESLNGRKSFFGRPCLYINHQPFPVPVDSPIY